MSKEFTAVYDPDKVICDKCSDKGVWRYIYKIVDDEDFNRDEVLWSKFLCDTCFGKISGIRIYT